MAEFVDPRMTNIKPRIRYNTIGGINGPLVVLDNVRLITNVADLQLLADLDHFE